MRRAVLWELWWEDLSVLSTLEFVQLWYSITVFDVSPLADVSALLLFRCGGITALPALRNTWLEVEECEELADLSGLASKRSRVGQLVLTRLPLVTDLAPIRAMQPPPRSVVLKDLPEEAMTSWRESVKPPA